MEYFVAYYVSPILPFMAALFDMLNSSPIGTFILFALSACVILVNVSFAKYIINLLT